MKINRILPPLLVCYLFGWTSIVMANDLIPSKKSASNFIFYGKVDAVYPHESRMVIGDISLKYTLRSLFLNADGSTIFNPINELKPGTPVKYHASKKKHNLIIINLKVISKDEFKNSQRIGRDNEY